jgi:hypothetical protein
MLKKGNIILAEQIIKTHRAGYIMQKVAESYPYQKINSSNFYGKASLPLLYIFS